MSFLINQSFRIFIKYLKKITFKYNYFGHEQGTLWSAVISISTLGWIVIGTQMKQLKPFKILPTSIEGCAVQNLTTIISDLMYMNMTFTLLCNLFN